MCIWRAQIGCGKWMAMISWAEKTNPNFHLEFMLGLTRFPEKSYGWQIGIQIVLPIYPQNCSTMQ